MNLYQLYPARGRVGRVTDCGVRGLGFKSPGSILTSRTETVLYHEWSGMVETHALCGSVGEKKVSYGGVFDLADEQPQRFRKQN